MPITTKICGLSTQESVETAISHGAAYVGFVFFPPSPRHISPEKAALISRAVPAAVKKVAVTVDMDDSTLDSLLNDFTPNYLQLHGQEPPERVAELRSRYQIPVIKALAISSAADLQHTASYEAYADILLFDAKPPKGAALPGGNGLAFDWELLRHANIQLPWFLSGGLSCQNIKEAVKISGAQMVDISSGVESSPGIKDNRRIAEFLTITNAL